MVIHLLSARERRSLRLVAIPLPPQDLDAIGVDLLLPGHHLEELLELFVREGLAIGGLQDRVDALDRVRLKLAARRFLGFLELSGFLGLLGVLQLLEDAIELRGAQGVLAEIGHLHLRFAVDSTDLAGIEPAAAVHGE